MGSFRVILAAGLFAVALVAMATAHAAVSQAPVAVDRSGAHDFDFQFGEWRVHHRVKRPNDAQQWLEFDGTCTARPLMDGSGNIEDNRFDKPTGVTYGVALRAYDQKTKEWAIWWIDSRVPHGALDPPMKGRFKDGVGTFYSDGTVDGKPMRVRYLWSNITARSARWEQAYSFDAEKTWETNWIMEFQRVQ